MNLPKRYPLLIFVLLFVTFFFVPPTKTYAQTPTTVNEQGSINGAAYVIKIPANWNNTLVIYAHGYRLKANRPGEVEDHNAYSSPTPSDWPALPDMEEYLLSRGYALAGSSYKQNGFAVKEGIDDTKALTLYFNSKYGKANKTVLLGFSMGGLIGASLIEQENRLYDGGILLSGLLAGTPLTVDRAFIDFAVAYNAAFGSFPAAWGTIDNINPNVDFQTQVIPEIAGKLSDPANFGKFEFIRLLLQLGPENFYGGGPNVPTLFFYGAIATEGRAELEARAGGTVAQNKDHTYKLSDSDKAYLASLGVNADPLLAAANGRRNVSASSIGRNYVQRYGVPEGEIERPVITLHGIGDGLNPPDHESVYALYVNSKYRGSNLLQVYTQSQGHGDFTQQQLLTAIQAMESWISTKHKPSASNFPSSQGFVPGYVPKNWPQPVRCNR